MGPWKTILGGAGFLMDHALGVKRSRVEVRLKQLGQAMADDCSLPVLLIGDDDSGAHRSLDRRDELVVETCKLGILSEERNYRAPDVLEDD